MVAANTKKKNIDEAKVKLEKKQAEKESAGDADEDLIDEEEYALIKDLKVYKQQYRDAFEQHRVLKTDVIQIEHLMQQCKAKLVTSFEEWYEQSYGHLIEKYAAEKEKTSGPPGGIDGEVYDPQEQFDLLE